MSRILSRDFYDRDTETVARELLGAIIEHRGDGGISSGRIVETEAYVGDHDPACHAAVGRTRRTEPLYGRPGTCYVYFIYGMHWCVNAVTRAEGLPSAVLVRAIEPLSGVRLMQQRRGPRVRGVNLTNGPAKLCAALGIDGAFNGLSLQQRPLVIRQGEPVADASVVTATRIGITKATDWPLRYYLADNPWVSR
ncbi:MAG: DNA-3-methyladenine glycosylase [Gemmatimonadaceae bacterium]